MFWWVLVRTQVAGPVPSALPGAVRLERNPNIFLNKHSGDSHAEETWATPWGTQPQFTDSLLWETLSSFCSYFSCSWQPRALWVSPRLTPHRSSITEGNSNPPSPAECGAHTLNSLRLDGSLKAYTPLIRKGKLVTG